MYIRRATEYSPIKSTDLNRIGDADGEDGCEEERDNPLSGFLRIPLEGVVNGKKGRDEADAESQEITHEDGPPRKKS